MDAKRIPEASAWNAERARKIIAEHLGLEGPMLPILHALQEEFGCVAAAAVPLIAEALNPLVAPTPMPTSAPTSKARPFVGVNPLRGQNNVQGACDMGSFPHEFSGYRHVSNDDARAIFEKAWGVGLGKEPGLRIPNMFDAAVEGTFLGIYVKGEDILQSDPDTTHVARSLAAMECVVVQDLFLNETANYAHVFLPGCTFLEKDGTFTNAERRIGRVRKVMSPKNGFGDWEITMALSNAMGFPMNYAHPSEIMD